LLGHLHNDLARLLLCDIELHEPPGYAQELQARVAAVWRASPKQ